MPYGAKDGSQKGWKQGGRGRNRTSDCRHPKKDKSYLRAVMKTGITNLVGVGLIGATASVANTLPTGTAKTLVGTSVGLQGVALLGPNLKLVKKSLKKTKRRKYF